jgi:neurofibromin 1
MVETCLPGADDLDVPHTCYPGALGPISSNLNLSSSMSSISLGSIHSPTDRGGGSGSAGGVPDGMTSLTGASAADCLGGLASTAILRGRHGSASHVSKHRGGSVKRDSTGNGGPNKSDSLG